MKGWSYGEPFSWTHHTFSNPRLTSLRCPAVKSVNPPCRRALSVVPGTEKGKSLQFQQERAEHRNRSQDSAELGLSDMKREMPRSGGRRGGRAVGWEFLGDDGRPSLCQVFVKRDKWSRGRMWVRCIHKAHEAALWNVGFHSPVAEQMLYLKQFVKTPGRENSPPTQRARRVDPKILLKRFYWFSFIAVLDGKAILRMLFLY